MFCRTPRSKRVERSGFNNGLGRALKSLDLAEINRSTTVAALKPRLANKPLWLSQERFTDDLATDAAIRTARIQEFLAMPMKLQRGVILAMIDEGIIRFEIRAS